MCACSCQILAPSTSNKHFVTSAGHVKGRRDVVLTTLPLPSPRWYCAGQHSLTRNELQALSKLKRTTLKKIHGGNRQENILTYVWNNNYKFRKRCRRLKQEVKATNREFATRTEGHHDYTGENGNDVPDMRKLKTMENRSKSRK